MPIMDSRWYAAECAADTDEWLLWRARVILSPLIFDRDEESMNSYLPLSLVQDEIQRRGLQAEYEALRQQLREERNAWRNQARKPFGGANGHAGTQSETRGEAVHHAPGGADGRGAANRGEG